MTIPGAALPPIRAVPVALAVIIIFTKNLQIIEVQRQMGMGLPRLDMIDVDDNPMLCRSPAGSVAKTDMGERGCARRSLCCYSEQLVDGPVLGQDIAAAGSRELAFADHVHGFIALDGPLCGGERSKSQRRIHAPFHKTMILLYEIIQTFALSQQTRLWEHLEPST